MPPKAAAVSGPTTSAPRTTRTRRVAPPAASAAAPAPVDALAADLDRVLKVSQPKAPVRRVPKAAPKTEKAAPKTEKEAEKPKAAVARRPAAVATTPSTSTARPAAPAPKTAPDAKRAASRTTTASRTPSTAPSTKSKQPAKEAEPEPPLPWEVAGGLSSRERAQAAQAASNGALRELSAAAAEGYKASSGPSARVSNALGSGKKGLAVLRELYAGLAGGQRVAVERGAMALVVKCLSMEMVSASNGQS